MTRKVLIGSLLLVLAFAMLMLQGDDSAGQKPVPAAWQAGQQEGR